MCATQHRIHLYDLIASTGNSTSNKMRGKSLYTIYYGNGLCLAVTLLLLLWQQVNACAAFLMFMNEKLHNLHYNEYDFCVFSYVPL